MIQDGLTRFQLSVWRPAQIGRRLDYAPENTDDVPDGTSFNCDWLHEEIYHWDPGQEDVWGGLIDQSVSNDVRNLFVEGFAPSLPPSERSMEQFREAVERLREHVAHGDRTSWADMMQVVRRRTREPVNLRSDAALALLHHLEWIVSTFGAVPSASVTIR